MKVKITGGNDLFITQLEGLQTVFKVNLLEGEELVENTEFEEIIAGIAPGLKVPSIGQTKYIFPVKSFFTTLSEIGSTEGNGHTFEITVEDQKGNSISDTLYVIVE